MKTINNQKKVIEFLEQKYPLSSQAEWDYSGFSLEFESKENLNILVAFEINKNVIDFAIENKVNLIITYHPFLFADSWEEYYLIDGSKKEWVDILSTNKISVYGVHTSLESNKKSGMCKLFADKLGFLQSKVEYLDYCFVVNHQSTFYKLNDLIKDKFNFKYNITNVQKDYELKNILFFPGSGDVFQIIDICKQKNIDLIVTSDIKWNNQQLLNSLGIKYLMISHHAENVFIDFMFDLLKNNCSSNVNVLKYYEDDFNKVI